MAGRYVALLRAVNVAGYGRVTNADLRRVFAACGCREVATHLQSGNVVFAWDGRTPPVAAFEQLLAEEAGIATNVILRSRADLGRICDRNPFEAACDPSKLHVTFLAAAPATKRDAGLEAPPGTTDEFALAGREVYLHCPGGYGRTKLDNAFFEKRLGVPATTRGWKTVLALRDLARA